MSVCKEKKVIFGRALPFYPDRYGSVMIGVNNKIFYVSNTYGWTKTPHATKWLLKKLKQRILKGI